MKIGIVGLGKFGSYHFEKYKAIPCVEEIWVCDPYIGRVDGANVTTLENLANEVDAVSITSPSVCHYEQAKYFLNHGIHCMAEKPICTSPSDAEELVEIAKGKKVVLQVGHIERFNSEYSKWKNKIKNVLFIDANRLCNYTGRSQDIDVILDLMIHDIDIVLQHIKSPISSIHAKGAGFCDPEKMDVVYTCIEFQNGSTATLTAHRASVHQERRTIFYGADEVVGIDYTKNENDSLNKELNSFVQCCLENTSPIVSAEDGMNALKTVMHIKKELRRSECTSDFQW